MNKDTSFHDNNRDFKSRTLFVEGEKRPVALFKSFVERRPLLKHPCDGLFYFYLSSKRSQKFKDLVQTKPMGGNTITNIMKVSVAGTSLMKKVRKTFTNHSARKTTVSKLKKVKIVNSEYIANITDHRGINFLNDYDEADEEERR